LNELVLKTEIANNMEGQKAVGVLGAGQFGIALANLLSVKNTVLLYTRSAEKRDRINRDHQHLGVNLNSKIIATDSLEDVCKACRTIFPVVPSASFRETIRKASKHLRPYHILIHGTKGLDLVDYNIDDTERETIPRESIRRMSEVILEETNVLRIGCLSGPNLAREIHEGHPTATVIASDFNEVIKEGQNLISSRRFFAFGSHDLIGAELAGSFKNIIALGSGMLFGLDKGKNMQALLVTRALREVILLGQALGSSSRAFLGTAGIGDIIATSFSQDSRNFQMGYRFSKGESISEILKDLKEVVEGLRTIKIAQSLAKHYNIQIPITETIYRSLYSSLSIERAIDHLMNYPYAQDVDFL
jgi:glycerol-3-phosphate dehydrogenase (NAD(P)+)